MKLTRRELAPLSLSIAAACASPVPPAQAQQRPGAGRPPPAPPTPRRERVGDLAGIQIEGTHGRSGVVLVAHAFDPGQVPRGAVLAARVVPGNQSVQASVTVLSRHADGSVRVAMITLDAPPVRGGERVGIILARAG